MREFPCRQCGAKVDYAPGTTVLRCPYCNTENEIAQDQPPVEELDFASALASLERAALHDNVRLIKCGSCAAEVSLKPNVTSLSCPFCGTNIVSQPVAASRVHPNAILPFKVDRPTADGAFRSWIKGRWFAPNKLKRQALLDQSLAGVYMPAWTYDCDAETAYTGQRGDAYYVSVGSGKNRRMERRIRWSFASGVVSNRFDDVLVLASNSLPTEKARALEPWDTKAVVPYADDYLAGFHAESYTLDLASGFDVAKTVMAPTIDATIRADIGGDEQRITTKRTRYSEVRFKHLLLPVWVSAYRYQGKVFRFLVNARTGEVQGERPYSAVKIALAVVAGLIALGGIIALIASQR